MEAVRQVAQQHADQDQDYCKRHRQVSADTRDEHGNAE
jgi:hypothetical protein